MKKVLAIILMICITAGMNMGIAAADEAAYENITAEETVKPDEEYEYTCDADIGETQIQTESEAQTLTEDEIVIAEESATQNDEESVTEPMTEQESETSAEDVEPITIQGDEEQEQTTGVEQSAVEPETVEIHEESLNVQARITITVTVFDKNIEDCYTKYGDEFFTKHMYDDYDTTSGKYNLTYTVKMADGTTFAGNRDELYARFGSYPEYYRSRVVSSEMVIYEKFLGETYYIWLKVVPHNHTIVTDPKVAATETSTGLTEGSHCSVCGDIIVKQEVIPTLQKHIGWYNANGTWFFYHDNGTMATGWLCRGTDNNGRAIWYYFNQTGAMITGWRWINGSWYYFYASGRMAYGWQKIGGVWYYMSSSGSMVTGWQKIGGRWYFFCNGGSMATGWLYRGQENGRNIWYYMDASGAMVTGWAKVGSSWYYLSSSGRMDTGWDKIGGSWYYLNPGGTMATGWKLINGSWYFFNGSGTMATGWLYRGKSDGAEIWYYFDPSGQMVTNWKTINDTQYYFKSSGRMAVGWVEVTSGSYQGKYYFDSDGVMHVGFLTIGDKKYYLDNSSDDNKRGMLQTGKFTYLEVTYTTDADGVIILWESEIVDIDSNAALGEKIVAYARQWVGVTPYVEAADRWTDAGYKNSLTEGTDCSGFTYLIYKTFGIDVPTGSDAYQTSVGISLIYEQLLPGDIIVYKNGGHVAIYAGNDTIIHCSNPTNGTIISNMWYSTPTKYIRVVF